VEKQLTIQNHEPPLTLLEKVHHLRETSEEFLLTYLQTGRLSCRLTENKVKSSVLALPAATNTLAPISCTVLSLLCSLTIPKQLCTLPAHLLWVPLLCAGHHVLHCTPELTHGCSVS